VEIRVREDSALYAHGVNVFVLFWRERHRRMQHFGFLEFHF
jgi:hypothetical protein